ncbi:unnamed protein product [Lathyrus sativus]|nr:unnamed protein product [Lathyrus sativus]
MEAHKERKEKVEKDNTTRGISEKKIIDNQINDDRCKRELECDKVSKRIICDSIISNGEKAQDPNDVLAFSRSVNNVDSSLE